MSRRDQLAAILRRPTVCMQAHDHARLMLRIEERRMGRTPIVAGGQGRTARQVRESAAALAGYMLVGAVLLLLLALCAGGAA